MKVGRAHEQGAELGPVQQAGTEQLTGARKPVVEEQRPGCVHTDAGGRPRTTRRGRDLAGHEELREVAEVDAGGQLQPHDQRGQPVGQVRIRVGTWFRREVPANVRVGQGRLRLPEGHELSQPGELDPQRPAGEAACGHDAIHDGAERTYPGWSRALRVGRQRRQGGRRAPAFEPRPGCRRTRSPSGNRGGEDGGEDGGRRRGRREEADEEDGAEDGEADGEEDGRGDELVRGVRRRRTSAAISRAGRSRPDRPPTATPVATSLEQVFESYRTPSGPR